MATFREAESPLVSLAIQRKRGSATLDATAARLSSLSL
jgi:hypothetical protein